MGLKGENESMCEKNKQKHANKQNTSWRIFGPHFGKKPVPTITGKTRQIPKLRCVWPGLATVPAQSIESMCLVENEDAVGAAQTGDAPTTSDRSTMLLPTKFRLILEVWWLRWEDGEFRWTYPRIHLWSGCQLYPNLKGKRGIGL